MADLQNGFSIQTKDFKKVVVGKKLGEGGQGAVYEVNFDGKKKALKWYSGKKIANPKKFYENLENNIKKGKPTNSFLWPEAITEKDGTAFGYIMDLRPSEYKDFSIFLINKEKFASITAMVNSAMQITAGFRELHRAGYSYQDLNDGNFFIDPKNGNVLICDNDNVSEYGKNSGIAGKARYMAPEIVAKGAKPSMDTDAFSLAVVLYMLWTNNHPLEGKAACPPCMNAENEKRIYGTDPVFVWDPKDDRNRPVQGIHKGSIVRWPFLPVYLQDMFKKAFSKELINDPQARILEQDWLRTFIRMRAEIFMCPICNDRQNSVYFADPINPGPCPKCGKTNVFSMYIKTQRYNVPVHQKTKLYACHTEKGSDDYETLTGEVSLSGSNYNLKNVTKLTLDIDDAGKVSTVAPGASVTLKKGMKISFGVQVIEVI
jgi:DNA-binding helix-hairpin-helix protein with protein kinase domain